MKIDGKLALLIDKTLIKVNTSESCPRGGFSLRLRSLYITHLPVQTHTEKEKFQFLLSSLISHNEMLGDGTTKSNYGPYRVIEPIHRKLFAFKVVPSSLPGSAPAEHSFGGFVSFFYILRHMFILKNFVCFFLWKILMILTVFVF